MVQEIRTVVHNHRNTGSIPGVSGHAEVSLNPLLVGAAA